MPEHLDPELEASTGRWMWAGVILMGLFVLAFPLYRIYEPGARADARQSQIQALEADGQNLFVNNCANCHGSQGEGVDAPALNSRQFLENVTQDQIESLIAHGIPGSEMAAWSLDFDGPLTSEQIRAIGAFLVSLRPDAPDRPDWREPGAEHGTDEESHASG